MVHSETGWRVVMDGTQSGKEACVMGRECDFPKSKKELRHDLGHGFLLQELHVGLDFYKTCFNKSYHRHWSFIATLTQQLSIQSLTDFSLSPLSVGFLL